jgi:hypothetical protein
MENLDLQQLEYLVYFFAALVVLVLGGLVVYVVVSVRRRSKEASAALLDIEDLVVRPSLLVVGQVLALVRDEAGGPIKVEIEGEKYASLGEIEDPKTKRQVVDSALEFIQFTGALGEGAISLVPLSETDSWREDMRQDSHAAMEETREPSRGAEARPAVSPATEEVEDRFLDLLTEMGQEPASPQKPTLTSSIQRTLRPTPAQPQDPRTFVDEIEEIVQRRVQLVPALVGRGLHVRSGQGGRVIFAFEGQEYDAVDAIPNLTARQVVKDSIQEWDELT